MSKAPSQVNVDMFEDFVVNEEVLINALLGRSNYLQVVSGSQRNIDKECQYPDQGELTVEGIFKPLYDRHAIAARVVEVFPKECWKSIPEIYEVEDATVETEFEKAWNEMSLSLLGKSKFKQKKGNPIWEYMQRVDILSGIGYYGIIFLGLDDSLDLREPAVKRDGQRLLFMRAFDQYSVDIVQYDNEPKSERFGLPVMYSVEFSSPEEATGLGVQSVVKYVHWSRVIHVADNLGSNEVFGVPRMKPVLNNILDLKKLYGGSAEMYWKGAFPGISIETHPHLGGASTVDTTKLKEAIQNYTNGLQRYLTLKGMAAKSLAPQVVDPSSQIETQIDAICIKLGIPKRIFMGSERGELASSQDGKAWSERLSQRQDTYLTPRVIAPFIDRLIDLGVLPEPTEYYINWPDLEEETKDEKASTAIKIVHAMTKYVAGDVEMIMSPMDFYTRVLGMAQDEAEQIIETALEAFEESEMRDLNRDILEAKALKKHQVPAISDDIKEELLQYDTEASTKSDALGEKFTDKASGKSNLSKLTKSRVESANPQKAADDLEQEDELV